MKLGRLHKCTALSTTFVQISSHTLNDKHGYLPGASHYWLRVSLSFKSFSSIHFCEHNSFIQHTMAAPTASVPPRALVPRVLIVAGSDSGGGAGIQADIKTCAAIGAFATTAVTALTAQDTKGVHGVHTVPAQFIGQQLDVVLSDIGVHVIKTGMLPNREAIAEVAAALEELSQTGSRSSTSDGANSSSRAVKNATDIDASLPPCPLLVVDPVMVSASGHALIDSDAVGALTSQLLPRAALVTPNLPEAKALLGGWAVNTVEEMRSAAKEIGSRFGCGAVLLKGGHLEDEKSAVVTDVYYESHSGRLLEFSSPRIPTRNSHGTGCTLASAISSHLARLMVENSRSSSSPCASLGVPSLLLTAVTRARGWLQQLLAASVPVTLGHGAHGPMNHSFAVDDYTGPSSPSSSSSSAAAALAANSSATSNDSSSSSSGSGLSISAPRPAAGSKRSAAVEAAGSEPAPESPVYSYFGSLSGPPASSKRPRVDDGGPSVSDAAANPSFDLRLYAVTDPRMNAKHGRSLVQAVSAAIDGGATIVQLREKNSETGEFVKAATDVMAYVSSLRASGDLRGGVRIIINDRVDVCLAAGEADHCVLVLALC